MAISLASLTSEFVGTFLLIFTVGCNVLSHNHIWAGVSIACVLMVCIYALGGASGAHFNPAVSFALGLAGKMEDGWTQVGAYAGVQVLAGIVAAFCYRLVFNDVVHLGPSTGHNWWHASLAEFFYSFMLVFAVLNTAGSKKLGGNNQFYGLTIGFTIIAGAYGAGAISGGCFNPAVAIALDISSFDSGFGWCVLYTLAELAGAGFAVLCFWDVRPEEKDGSELAGDPSLRSKLASEFLGTMMLVLTVGLNVLAGSKAAAFSIAAALMCMIYATGDVSGGHFNPAVTVAILASGRSLISVKDAGLYVLMQVFGGLCGAIFFTSMHHMTAFPLGPAPGHSWAGVCLVETLFTFVLTFTVLCVASVRNKPATEYVGLIIGSCVTVGGFASGKISGGSLNPAVSIGISFADTICNGGLFYQSLLYGIFEVLGGGLAASIFRVVYPEEYEEAESGKSV